jgi:lactoylglutathione lyase
MKKVTGVGGIFFKCDNPKGMNEWYAQNLGLNATQYGAKFEWRNLDHPEVIGTTAWSTFPQTTQYFNPSTKPFMINYIVENIELLVEELKKNQVTVVDEIADYDYGKFVHILDPEGNIIELWEPKDEVANENEAK